MLLQSLELIGTAAAGDVLMLNAWKRFLSDESGATAIEYGLIVVAIAIACIAAFNALGLDLANIMNFVASKL